MSDAPQILLNHRLKSLRLPTVLREYGKLAKQAAAEGLDHVQFLGRLIELEMIDRERRMIERPLSGHCYAMPCRATGSRLPNSLPSKAPLSAIERNRLPGNGTALTSRRSRP